MLGKQCIVAPEFHMFWLDLQLGLCQEFGIITVGVDYRNFPRPSVMKMAQGDKVTVQLQAQSVDDHHPCFTKDFLADKKQLVISYYFVQVPSLVFTSYTFCQMGNMEQS